MRVCVLERVCDVCLHALGALFLATAAAKCRAMCTQDVQPAAHVQAALVQTLFAKHDMLIISYLVCLHHLGVEGTVPGIGGQELLVSRLGNALRLLELGCYLFV